MSKQVVTRTHVTRRGYYHNENDYCNLKKLLEEGYKVIRSMNHKEGAGNGIDNQ